MAEAQPPEGQVNIGGAPTVASLDTVGSKRHRRPSVRLGDIGDQPYETHVRSKANKQWKHQSFDPKKESHGSGKSSKIRPLMNLSAVDGGEFRDAAEGGDGDKIENLDGGAIGSWKVKDPKRRGSNPVKRVRSNWVPKIDEGGGEGNECEEIDDGSRDFGVENSGSPLKEHSPIHCLENLVVDGHGNDRDVLYRRPIPIRARDHHDGVEMSGPSDNDGRDWKSVERNGSGGRGRRGEDGVRIWLSSLGLGRYATVFEIHEVDDEVLPMLTLEDLKDMGITAVGSRRKMYCAIQKLGKGFS